MLKMFFFQRRDFISTYRPVMSVSTLEIAILCVQRYFVKQQSSRQDFHLFFKHRGKNVSLEKDLFKCGQGLNFTDTARSGAKQPSNRGASNLETEKTANPTHLTKEVIKGTVKKLIHNRTHHQNINLRYSN